MRILVTTFLVLLAAVLLVGNVPAPARAAGVTIENFSNMGNFQSSALYAFINGGAGGTSARKANRVRGVRQGASDVPTSSAGAANNTTVTSEIMSAASDVPDVFSLNGTSSYYDKRFVSLGTSTATPAPFIDIELTPVSTLAGGGYNGYDIVVFDLGKSLVTASGNNNTEATTFQVELVSAGVFYSVGSITSTMGNFINAILLDVTGIPGIPDVIDAVRITDVTGGGTSASGGLDVDGALTLNVGTVVPTIPVSWGSVKALYTK
jgi:hypothetical protein